MVGPSSALQVEGMLERPGISCRQLASCGPQLAPVKQTRETLGEQYTVLFASWP